jgi:hypothetical protein
LLLLLLLLLQVLEVVLQQRVERGGQQVLVQDFIGSSIGAQARVSSTNSVQEVHLRLQT